MADHVEGNVDSEDDVDGPPEAKSSECYESGDASVDGVRLHLGCRSFCKVSGHKIEQWLAKTSGVPIQKVFKVLSWRYAFATVLPEHSSKFREAIDGALYRNASIQVRDGHARDANNRRPKADQEETRLSKRQKIKDFPPGYVPTLKDLKDKLKHKDPGSVLRKSAPLLDYSYETQLSMKGTYVKSAVRSFTKLMEKKCQEMNLSPPSWTSFEWSKGAGGPLGCACPLDEPIGTPLESLEGYRNKCEFSIGKNETGEIEVGFVLRVTEDGFGRVVSKCDDVPFVPSAMKQLCSALRECVRASPFKLFERGKGWSTGVWRMVMARLSSTGDMLVLVQTSTLSDDDKSVLSKSLEESLVSAKIGVVSIYLQFNDEVSDAARPGTPLHHIFGEPQLKMPLLGLTFNIGPLSFYQANNTTCALLYSRALDWLQPSDATVVLDICCGVGTIGLCAARRCRQVIGIELVPEAVESAKANAELNGVTNSSWRVGRAEDVLPAVLDELDSSFEVCAVVDPPRPGLHPTVLGALRSCTQLSRLVYVSCNPESLVEDVVKLTLPRESDEDPLVPVRAVAVDMFPHTMHCEMILLMERSSRVKDPRNLQATTASQAQDSTETTV